MDNIQNQNNSQPKNNTFTVLDHINLIKTIMFFFRILDASESEYLDMKARIKELLRKFESLDIAVQMRMTHTICEEIKLIIAFH